MSSPLRPGIIQIPETTAEPTSPSSPNHTAQAAESGLEGQPQTSLSNLQSPTWSFNQPVEQQPPPDEENNTTSEQEQEPIQHDSGNIDAESAALIEELLNDDMDNLFVTQPAETEADAEAEVSEEQDGGEEAAAYPQDGGGPFEHQIPVGADTWELPPDADLRGLSLDVADLPTAGDNGWDNPNQRDVDTDEVEAQHQPQHEDDPTAHFLDVDPADTNTESQNCPACYNPVAPEEVVYLTCGHVWCRDCLNNNIRAALSQRNNFPPECCGVADRSGGINIAAISSHLDDDVLIRWLAVGEEFACPNPTYCHNQRCGSFIPTPSTTTTTTITSSSSQWATCRQCHTTTCTDCKAAYLTHSLPAFHPDLISAEDQALATQQGWKQCPNLSCRKLLERIDGCDHMTCCDCGTDFCYRCGRVFDHESLQGLACNCNGQNRWVEEDDEDEGRRDEVDDEGEEDRGWGLGVLDDDQRSVDSGTGSVL